MPTEICGILLALVATHRTDWTDLSTAWLTPKTDSRGFSPDKAEIARTYPQANQEWELLFDSKARLPPSADCGTHFRHAGRKLAPWPKSVKAPPGWRYLARRDARNPVRAGAHFHRQQVRPGFLEPILGA